MLSLGKVKFTYVFIGAAVSNCSSTKTVPSSNLSQHILTMIVCKIANLTFLVFVKCGILIKEWSSDLCCRNITDSTNDHSVRSLKVCVSLKSAELVFLIVSHFVCYYGTT